MRTRARSPPFASESRLSRLTCPTLFALLTAGCLLHEPYAVVAGRSIGCCAEVETVGHNNSDTAENDRRRQIHEIVGEAAVWPPRRGLQHVSAASAARPGHAHVVVLTPELRDVEERSAIMWISAGQNLF